MCGKVLHLYIYVSLSISPFFFRFSLHMQHATCMHAQSCPILCDPMDCSPPGSTVHGIFQIRILEWIAISSSRESSWTRDSSHISYVSCIGRWILYHWATWEAPKTLLISDTSSASPHPHHESLGLSWLGGWRGRVRKWKQGENVPEGSPPPTLSLYFLIILPSFSSVVRKKWEEAPRLIIGSHW